MHKEQRFDLHFEKIMVYCPYGALAQLGARHTGSVEATGSSPVCSIPRIFCPNAGAGLSGDA